MSPDELMRVFGRRVLRERTKRGWSLREMAGRADMAASTISRAENGHALWLRAAMSIADVLGIPFTEMFSEPDCLHCDGKPPAGFMCPECGRLGGAG